MLSSSAGLGNLLLPRCTACGSVQYPPRDYCGQCLSPAIEYTQVSGGGELAATAMLHKSADPRFQQLLPLHIGSVRLDAGPVLLVFLIDHTCRKGDRVHVRVTTDGMQGLPSLQAARAEWAVALTKNPCK